MRAELGGGLAATLRPGPGAKVLWLHGYAMDTRVWAPLWQRLPDLYHVGVDLPGHGRSARLPADLHAGAERLAEVASRFAIDHVVGLSYGGVVALEVLALAPDHFRSAVLGAPSLPGTPHDAVMERIYQQLIAVRAGGAPPAELAARWQAAPVFVHLRDRGEAWDLVLAAIAEHPFAEATPDGMRAMAQGAPAGRFAAVTTPAAVVVGEHDLPATRRAGEAVAAQLAGGAVVHAAGCGHLALLERPDAAAGLVAAVVGGAPPAITPWPSEPAG